MSVYKTEQEDFWTGQFGDEYTVRNNSQELIDGDINFFSSVLSKTEDINSVIEFGSNIGLNLIAIRKLLNDVELSGIEINENAVKSLKDIEGVRVYQQSIFDFKPDYKRDLVFTKTVLIHINPQKLPLVYDLLYETSQRYICLAEYHNPTPIEVNYRGHAGKLFKRDFAGEMLDRFPFLRLIDYGFFYNRDTRYYDDTSWFLLERSDAES